MNSRKPRRVGANQSSVTVAALMLCLVACAGTTKQFVLPASNPDHRITLRVRAEGEPKIVTAPNPLSGFFGGAAGGAYYDCIFWLCVPVFATVGAFSGLAVSAMPTVIDATERALAAADVGTYLGDLLVNAVVAKSNELPGYRVTPVLQTAPDALAAGAATELVITPGSVGISSTGSGSQSLVFSLSVDVRLGDQQSEPITFKSAAHDLKYWTDNNAHNVRSACADAIDQVATKLINVVFGQAQKRPK